VDEVAPHDEQALREQLARARERLAGLERDLRVLDAELELLDEERPQYQLLQEVCGALEKLGELQATDLFWGEQAVASEGTDHVRRVRSRVDEFHGRVQEIEARRRTALGKIELEQENVEFIEEDIDQALQEEERRKQAWIVEREVDVFPSRGSVMPWTRGGEDDRRFRKSLAVSLALGLLLGLLLPQFDLPLPEPLEEIEVSERLARLIRESRPLPPRSVAEVPPQEPVLEPEQQQEPEPVEESPLLAEQGTPKPNARQEPQRHAGSKGLLAFREKFSGLAASPPDARLGARASISNAGEAAHGRPERSMVVTQASGSSGGINLASLSRNVGGGGGSQIEGVQVARATSSIGSGTGSERPQSGGPGSARTDEEIQIVFDRHKSALYRLYNRELRRDPTLKGQMVLRLRIEPDGSVSFCELQSTDMNAPQLAAQVVARVGTFDFGAKEGIPAVTIVYPIDFLPAT
jgi:hypothetical protein